MAGTQPRTAPLPSRIGRHQVVGYIATGGMAELFLGKESPGRPVVIKRILPHLARQGAFVSMFIDEARIGSMAKHPNLVEVLELGQVGTDLFLVMEYLVGENLAGLVRRLIKRGERMPYGLAAYIIAEVCDGLHAAHELVDENDRRLELVHRDVSPQNIFITYGGDVKLLDFGVATAHYRLTQTATGEVKGKYAYMSPEQCRGEELDRRSDIFSLGTVLYELTTLHRLFKRPNELQVMKAVCDEPIPRPTREIQGYPTVLEEICVRALARDRRHRYATALEMRDALLAAMSQLGLEGDPHEALASKLARLFGDRVAQKRELLDRMRAGGELEDLLKAEVDEAVEVPVVSQNQEATSLSRIRPRTPVDETTDRHRRWRPSRLVIALLLAVLVGGSAGAWMRLHARGAAAQADAGVHVERVVTPLPSAPPPDAIPTTVQLRVETSPAGVHVIVDGHDEGVTPRDVTLPRGTTPVKVELREAGFQSSSQDLVPDRDQRLYITLIRIPKRVPPVKHPPKESGFHRFD